MLKVADVGSGGGFPGFVVGVARPDCKVTLIESHQRKAVFLREASRKLVNVWVSAMRAELIDTEERFDWMISRGVSYGDLAKCLPGLAANVALLTGAEKPPALWKFDWEFIPLPWGDQQFLRIGRAVVKEK